MEAIYHRLIKKDLRTALDYYQEEGGEQLADRFFHEAEQAVAAVLKHPTRYHFAEKNLRRVSFDSFPYHFLYEVYKNYIRFLVLRHDRRHPSFGLRRK